jgi:hypothetical protein
VFDPLFPHRRQPKNKCSIGTLAPSNYFWVEAGFVWKMGILCEFLAGNFKEGILGKSLKTFSNVEFDVAFSIADFSI